MSERVLVSGFHWMAPRNDSAQEFIWYVGHKKPYIWLPQPGVTRIEGSVRDNPFKFPSPLNPVAAPLVVEPQIHFPIPEAPPAEIPESQPAQSPPHDIPMGAFHAPSPQFDQGQPSSTPHPHPGYDAVFDKLLAGQSSILESMHSLRLDMTHQFDAVHQRLDTLEERVDFLACGQSVLCEDFYNFSSWYGPLPRSDSPHQYPSAPSSHYSPPSWEQYNQYSSPVHQVSPIPGWQQCSPWRDPQPAAPYYMGPFPPPSPMGMPAPLPAPHFSAPSSSASFVPMDEDEDWTRHDAPSGDEA